MSFEWQSEEQLWGKEPISTKQDVERRPHQHWAWLVVLLPVLAGGGLLVWDAARNLVNEATELVEGDVRASHALARQTARERDAELFTSLLSGRSRGWTEAQQERLEAGLLFAQTGRLLGLEPLARPPHAVAVTFNAELTEAVLSSAESYTTSSDGAMPQMDTFTQIAVYRKGNQRWLLSPPGPEFWGEWQTTSGKLLHVTYPERDAAIVVRLAEDIDAMLEELCLTLVICPRHLTMRLRLESDPRSVLIAADAQALLAAENELTLPTPTLIGLPLDDAAYKALSRGYAAYVARAMLLKTANYDCCEHVLFQQAITELQLADLGLRGQPLEPQDYLALLDHPPAVTRLNKLWWEDSPSQDARVPIVYSLLDFVRQQGLASGNTLRDYQLALAEGGRTNFWKWLAHFTDYNLASSEAFQHDWQAFIYAQLLRAQATWSLPNGLSWSEQDLLAFCGDDTLDVYRYHFQQETWLLELQRGFEHGMMATFPDDMGFLVAGLFSGHDREPRVETWMKRGEAEPLHITGGGEVGGPAMYPWPTAGPSRTKMFAWLGGHFSQTPGSRAVLLDPGDCSGGGCRYEEVPGLPVWSPDGRAVIYIMLDRAHAYLQQPGQTSMESLGESQYVAWLDNQNFLQLKSTSASRGGQVLLARTMSSMNSSELVTAGALHGALPDGSPTEEPLFVQWAGPDPADPNQILLIASARAPALTSHVFALTRSGTAESWMDTKVAIQWLDSFSGAVQGHWISPLRRVPVAGRWLALTVNSRAYREQGTLLYDLRHKRTALLSLSSIDDKGAVRDGDWSADERWFVYGVPGAAVLVAPDFGNEAGVFRYVVPHDFERCESFAWTMP